jgi:hypothetical protein
MKDRSLYRELVKLLILEKQEILHAEWESTQKKIQSILLQIRDSADEVDKMFVEIACEAGHVTTKKESANGKDS